jgi:hypothetical protein
MPSLITNYQKQQTVMQLKKVFSILNQTLQLSEIDNGPNTEWGCTGTGQELFEKYVEPYFKIAEVCSAANKYCGYGTYNPWYYLSGSKETVFHIHGGLGGVFRLADGVIVSYYFKSSSGGCDNPIIVDLNGIKPPNVYGKDVFMYGRGVSGVGRKSWGSGVAASCTAGGSGVFCATKIIDDGWEIKEDYPW